MAAKQKILFCALAAALLLAAPLAAEARHAPLTDPQPILLPAPLPEPAIEAAIRRAFAAREWIAANAEPGYIEGTLLVRTHMAKVGVWFDRRAVRVRYLDSEGLGYTQRGREQLIHPNYNGWVANLAQDIGFYLAQAAER